MYIDLMVVLEGLKLLAYDCTSGKRTIGIGFNMDMIGAKELWLKLCIKEDFDLVYNQKIAISELSATMLFRHMWAGCDAKADKRAKELNLNYSAMADYKRFVLADIVYNTGSISGWTKVLQYKEPRRVLTEARRKPHKYLDNRVARIGNYFGIISSVEEAIDLGLTETTDIEV